MKFYRSKTVLSFLISASIILLSYFVFHWQYEEMDDVLMMMAASGFYTGTPDFHLVYISPLWGLLVQKLYMINENFDWYSFLLIAVHWISAATLLRILLGSFNWLTSLGIWSIWFFGFQLYVLMQLQFTTTAAVAGAAAIACFIAKPDHIKAFLAGSFLLFICALIRYQVFQICVFAFIPFLVFQFYHFRLKRSFLFPFLGFSIGLLTFFSVSLNWGYSSDWSDFQKLSKERNALIDNIGFLTTPVPQFNLEEINYTANDLNLLRAFISDDSLRVNHQTLAHLKSNLMPSPTANWAFAFKNVLTKGFNVFFIIFLSIGLILFNKENKFKLILACIFIALGFAYVVQTGSFLKLRVVNAGFLILVAIIIAQLSLTKLKTPYFSYGILIVAALFIGLKTKSALALSKKIKFENESFNQQFFMLNPLNLSIIDLGYSLNINRITPLNNNIQKSFGKNYYNTSWYAQSPVQKACLSKLGVKKVDELFINEKALLVYNERSFSSNLFVNKIEQDWGIKMVVDTLKKLNNETIVVKLTKQTNAKN